MKTQYTLEKFTKESSIPASLIRAVVRKLGGWKSFKESAPDICRGGIDGGFHGFIYYTDTVPFAKRNLREIQSYAEQQAIDLGSGVIAMIQGFNCFKHDKPSEAEVGEALYGGRNKDNNVLNALAWYAGEEVSRAYCDLTGQN
jgi:hypothetical protein